MARRQRCRLYVSQATGKSTCREFEVAQVLVLGPYGEPMRWARDGKRKKQHSGIPTCAHHLREWATDQYARRFTVGELFLGPNRGR